VVALAPSLCFFSFFPVLPSPHAWPENRGSGSGTNLRIFGLHASEIPRRRNFPPPVPGLVYPPSQGAFRPPLFPVLCLFCCALLKTPSGSFFARFFSRLDQNPFRASYPSTTSELSSHSSPRQGPAKAPCFQVGQEQNAGLVLDSPARLFLMSWQAWKVPEDLKWGRG